MKKCFARLLAVAVAVVMMLGAGAFAHSGRTDSSGGHRDNKNKSGLGSYHYHCGGYPAHLHDGGVCPYTSPVHNSASVASKEEKVSVDYDYIPNDLPVKMGSQGKTVQNVQAALIELEYLNDVADGIFGKNTQTAVSDFCIAKGIFYLGEVDEDLYSEIIEGVKTE